MNVNVKICGIRSIDSALAAIEAGADFIGLNFVPTSKRKIDDKTASEIIGAVKGQVKIVGVFQNELASVVNDKAKRLQLDFVQLHGEEDAAYCKQIEANVIKAIAIKSTNNVDEVIESMKKLDVPFYLLDREKQGEGESVNLQNAHKIAQVFEVFLAGGLTPENVAERVKEVKPFAVDVAGGIETDGKEDFEKIRQFVLNVKGI